MEQQIKKTAHRVRSPNYPNYTLRECVAFMEKLYPKYGSSEIHVEDAITQMGHSPTSSTAARVLASMLSYELIKGRGAKDNKFVSLTKLAQELILEEKNSPHWYDLLQKAALADDSMQLIWNKWGTNLPVEETIKKSLQLEMTYSPEGAKRFAFVITDNYEFTQLSKTAVDVAKEELEEEPEEEKGDVDKKPLSQTRKANLLLPGAGREIVIFAPTDLTNTEFDLVFKWLELQKYGLVVPPAKKDSADEQKEQEADIPF